MLGSTNVNNSEKLNLRVSIYLLLLLGAGIFIYSCPVIMLKEKLSQVSILFPLLLYYKIGLLSIDKCSLRLFYWNKV